MSTPVAEHLLQSGILILNPPSERYTRDEINELDKNELKNRNYNMLAINHDLKDVKMKFEKYKME